MWNVIGFISMVIAILFLTSLGAEHADLIMESVNLAINFNPMFTTVVIIFMIINVLVLFLQMINKRTKHS